MSEPPPVHGDVGHTEAGNRRVHLRVGEAATDVVDEAGTGRDRCCGGRGAHRVDAHRNTNLDQSAHDGQDPPAFLSGGHAMGTGAGGLAPDVDHVSALFEQAHSVLDRGLRSEKGPAVGEGVGSHVQDAHDGGSVESGQTDGQALGSTDHRPRIKAMASARVAGSRRLPRTALVTVFAPGLRTPRMDMHRCSASMTTIAPRGWRMRTSESAT